jgi:hypothetical protein
MAIFYLQNNISLANFSQVRYGDNPEFPCRGIGFRLRSIRSHRVCSFRCEF